MRKEILSVGLLVGAMFVAGCGGGSSSGGGSGGSLSGGSSIYNAAAAGDDAAIRTAVESGTNVDAPGKAGRTGLLIAVHNSNLRTAKTLLDLGANPAAADKNGKTPLMWAASRGYNDLLKDMLAKKPELNAQDNAGYTAAHHAANMNNVAGYNLLKSAGANVTLTDKRGRTASDIAEAKRQQMMSTTAPAM